MSNITLTADQEYALKIYSKFLVNKAEKYMIIQGHAGSGKSTLITYLSKILNAQYQMYSLLLKQDKTKSDFEFCLTATTNKAAIALTDVTNIEATTIHSLLNLTITPNMSTGTTHLTKKQNYKLLYNKLIIIDEASMINDELFLLLDQTTVNCKIILMGDPYQLAPVKQTTSIMDTLTCTKVSLNTVVRHTGNIEKVSTVLRNIVKTNTFTDIPLSAEVKQVTGSEFKQLINKAFTASSYDVTTDKIIARTNKRVHEYNNHIRTIKKYPINIQPGEIVYTNNPIMLGKFHWPVDAAIHITHIGNPIISKNVAGHMIQLDCKVSGFMPDNPMDTKQLLKQLAIKAKTNKAYWAEYFAIKETWLDLRPAYASTVHKTQGSQYDTVYIDLVDIGQCYVRSDFVRLLYVSFSRAIKQIYIYGQIPPHYQLTT